MDVIYLLIVVSIGVALCFLATFLWAVRDGQFDDDYGPSVRMLFDDEQIDNISKGKEIEKLVEAKNDNQL